jgi:2'-5' RNA ligase
MSRVFFALWPDASARDALHRAARDVQRASGGRAMPHENLHQTLVFIGSVAAAELAPLERLAGRISAAPFDLAFGSTGYWRHNRIVWAAPVATPPPLTRLVAMLEQALAQSHCAYDNRPYCAHVTLLRDARAPASLPPLEFDWPVRDFALIESGRGPRGAGYRVVNRWPLTG